MQVNRSYKFTFKLALVLLASQALASCSAVKTVAGVGYDVVAAPFRVAAWLIPDGGADEAPPPTGTDDNPKVGRPYQINGRWYTPKTEPNYEEVGYASWYGPQFHGKATANGEEFDMNQLTAAHRTLPLPSYVRVTNLSNGRSVVLRVNDRGPFANDRILDVSRRGAQILGFEQKGVQRVKVELVDAKGRKIGKSKPKKQTASAKETVKYFVQVASFSNQNTAKNLAAELDDAYVVSANVSGNTVYRVRLGPFSAENKANKALKNIRNKGHPSAKIFRETTG